MNPHTHSQEAELNPNALRMLGLAQQPFCERPSGHEYFFDPVMQMQLNMLQHNLKYSDMLQVLKGDPGSGKTALVIQMLAHANDEFQIFVARGKPSLTAMQVLTGMVKIFQQPVPEDPDSCVDLLIRHLQLRLDKNLSSVLIIENTHEVSADSLNELFGFVDRINEPLEGELRLLLIASPEIEEILPSLDSHQLRQGKMFISNMRTLDRQRTRDYIEHRLRTAGYTHELPLSARDLDEIYDLSQGVPFEVDIATATLFNRTADEVPWQERLHALPLRAIAGGAVGVIVLALLMFLFSDSDSAGSPEPGETRLVELAPTVITETTEPAASDPKPASPSQPVPPVEDPETATITLLSELESPPNNQFIDSHGLSSTTADEPVKPEEVVPTSPAPEPQSTPAAPEEKPVQRAPSEDESWLLKQKEERFIIQLLASYDSKELETYIRKHGISDKAVVVRTLRNGRTWHVLLLGLYKDAPTARTAIARLSAGLRRNTPWVRSIKSVQIAIGEFQSG